MTFKQLYAILLLLLPLGLLVPGAGGPAAVIVVTYLLVNAAPALLEQWTRRKTTADDLERMLDLVDNRLTNSLQDGMEEGIRHGTGK